MLGLVDRLDYIRDLGIGSERTGRIHAARLDRLVEEGAIMRRPAAHSALRSRPLTAYPQQEMVVAEGKFAGPTRERDEFVGRRLEDQIPC